MFVSSDSARYWALIEILKPLYFQGFWVIMLAKAILVD